MKTKIVYTVIGGESDIYAYQAWVSVDSLRHHQPDAHVEIVCDTATAGRIAGMPLGALADKVTAIEFPAGMSARERSRRLKTNLREYVEGDYLYIDTDTIITAPLDPIDEYEGSLYAVHDAHCTVKDNPYMEMNRKNAAVLGYSLDGEEDFFNGGVVYAKDDEAAAAFYAKWNELYDLSTRRGIFIDQTSFAKANIDLGHVLQELPGVWNCQLRHGARFLGGARIVHYLWTAKRTPSPFLLGERGIWDGIMVDGVIPASVKALYDDPFSGIQDLTYLASTEETAFLNSRTYKVAYKFEHGPGTFRSAFSLCLRALDFVYKLFHK